LIAVSKWRQAAAADSQSRRIEFDTGSQMSAGTATHSVAMSPCDDPIACADETNTSLITGIDVDIYW